MLRELVCHTSYSREKPDTLGPNARAPDRSKAVPPLSAAVGASVALLRKGPLGRPAFMLRDQQVYDYATDAELIGRAVRLTYPYRRFLQT